MEQKKYKRELTTGEKIKNIRIKKGLTQSELSDETGIHKMLISKYETNKVIPKTENIDKICKVLNIDPAVITWFPIKNVDELYRDLENYTYAAYNQPKKNDESIKKISNLLDYNEIRFKNIWELLKEMGYNVIPSLENVQIYVEDDQGIISENIIFDNNELTNIQKQSDEFTMYLLQKLISKKKNEEDK